MLQCHQRNVHAKCFARRWVYRMRHSGGAAARGDGRSGSKAKGGEEKREGVEDAVARLRRKQPSAGRPCWWIPSAHYEEVVPTEAARAGCVTRKQLVRAWRARIRQLSGASVFVS
jgi:hypothetical protein